MGTGVHQARPHVHTAASRGRMATVIGGLYCQGGSLLQRSASSHTLSASCIKLLLLAQATQSSRC